MEDKESLNEEVKMKFVNILKMLVYLYVQTVVLIEKRNVSRNDRLIKGRKKANKNVDFSIDKKSVLLLLNNLIEREISLFWYPPVVEENFINLVSGICYEFLQNPDVKSEKDELSGIFNVLGCLLKCYNHGTTFTVRITQLIKMHEHLIHCLPKGIQQIVQDFNCKGLLHDLIEELTEWQTDEKYSDAQVNKF